MKEFWNERYSQEEFVYGTLPNVYLQEALEKTPGQTILFPAEGEGRNAVYAATKGWNVSAFDQSEEGKKKALALADKNQVTIDYAIATVEEISYEPASFDVLALIYAHFPVDKRRAYHQQLASFIKPNGYLIIEGFEKEHILNQQKNPNSGGPKNSAMLYELNEIKADFEGFEFIKAEKMDIELSEGEHHKGEASVVRILAKKI
jgi:2-polyprenyl-3-methyl-5-hydroxy-6-metoxy-1,4-benzoquinol methylase